MHDDHSHSGFTHVQPQFSSSDLSKSIAYYTDVLGFELIWLLTDEADNPTFANVARDALAVFLAQHPKPLPAVLNAHTESAAFIDQVFAEIKNRGAMIEEPPSDRPWGLYEMRVIDPDGNTLRMQAFSEKQHEG